jgi:hypothetical protein
MHEPVLPQLLCPKAKARPLEVPLQWWPSVDQPRLSSCQVCQHDHGEQPWHTQATTSPSAMGLRTSVHILRSCPDLHGRGCHCCVLSCQQAIPLFLKYTRKSRPVQLELRGCCSSLRECEAAVASQHTAGIGEWAQASSNNTAHFSGVQSTPPCNTPVHVAPANIRVLAGPRLLAACMGKPSSPTRLAFGFAFARDARAAQ